MLNTNETKTIGVDQYRQTAVAIEKQLSKVIVGQRRLVHDMLVTLLAAPALPAA